MNADKLIICSDCRQPFSFSAREQEYFESKGFTSDPKRCPECRRARKRQRYGSNSFVNAHSR